MAGRLRYRRIEALTNTIENPAGSPSYDAAFLSSPLEPACCPSGGAKPRTAAWHPAVLRLQWVEFQNKFYHGDGVMYKPFAYAKLGAARDE